MDKTYRNTSLIRISKRNQERLRELKKAGTYTTMSRALDSLIDMQLTPRE